MQSGKFPFGYYPCSQCDYVGSQKHYLKTHVQSVHEDIKYPCSKCDYQASAEFYLKNHYKNHHLKYYPKTSEESVDEVVKYYPCSKCDYQATILGYLKRHEKYIHEGIKYPCSMLSLIHI